MTNPSESKRVWSRRHFLTITGLSLAEAAAMRAHGQTASPSPLSFGIVTDCHYAERDDPKGQRFYRDSCKKLADCVAEMNRRKVDFLIELGDFKDLGETADATLKNLEAIEAVFRGFTGPRYHVLGNHDADRITKEQFLARVANTGFASAQPFYSFDVKGVHFAVLDANHNADGSDYRAGNFDWKKAYVPHEQLAWLKSDLKTAARPTVVFVHQLLDADTGDVYVRNAAEVRRILEESGHVRAVFQGHHHEGNYSVVNGIPYYTLKALVIGRYPQNNAFATVTQQADGRLAVAGFGHAESRTLPQKIL